MDLPRSLPGRLYLLAYDPRRPRFASPWDDLPLILRAAALTDLYLDGRLTDEDGRPHAVTSRRDAATTVAAPDPFLETIWSEVADSRPRSWRSWIQRTGHGLTRAVREQMADGGWIRVERHRVLGILPDTRTVVRDRAQVIRLTEDVKRMINGTRPLTAIDPRDAATAALATTGHLRTVAGLRDRNRHRARINALAAQSGPAIPALRRALLARHAAYHSGAASGAG